MVHPARPWSTPSARAEDVVDGEAFARCLAWVDAHAVSEREGAFGAASRTWRQVAEPALLLGGSAAVLLQMAHPSIAAAITAHSTFRRDVRARAARTTQALYELTFGTLSQARDTGRRLHLVHRMVRGAVDEPGAPMHGAPYRANAPDLLKWVAATTMRCATGAVERFVDPGTDAERAATYREFQMNAALTGVEPSALPADRAGFDAWYAEALDAPHLRVGPNARGICDALLGSSLLPRETHRLVTTALLPPRWRDAYALPWGAGDRRAFDRLRRRLDVITRAVPAPWRYVPAWHQAMHRLDRSAVGRVVDRAARHARVPLSLCPEAHTRRALERLAHALA